MVIAVSVDPVKATPARRVSENSDLADFRAHRPAEDEGRLRRHASLMQQAHGRRRDQRRLFGGLRENGIAGRQGAGDLSDENREREIPRRDAEERPAPVQREMIGLSRRTGKFDRVLEFLARLGRVIAQEIDRLAQFAQRIRQDLAALAHRQRHELRAVVLEKIGGLLQNRGTRVALERIPVVLRAAGSIERAHDIGFGDLGDLADRTRAIRRIANTSWRSRPVSLPPTRWGRRCGTVSSENFFRSRRASARCSWPDRPRRNRQSSCGPATDRPGAGCADCATASRAKAGPPGRR